MNKYEGKSNDIHTRIYELVKNCYLNVIKSIPKRTETIPIISQVVSSLTSIGANDREADGALTKKDFISKYSIAKKEIKETIYWLTLIKDLKLSQATIVESYIKECHEVLLIISKIINNTLYK
jgi:four helix bundle protein